MGRLISDKSSSIPLLLVSAALIVLVGCSSHVLGQDFRLPTNLVPDHYDLQILARLDPAEDFIFEGSVAIRLTCVSDTDSIVLHNFQLAVDEANVVLTEEDGGRQIGIISHEYDWSYADFQTITLEESLQADKVYILYIPYSGTMRPIDDRYGLTYGQYNGDQGLEYFASTQMEPLGALATRWAFPCFDEPALKATFNITVGYPKKYSAFSNMQQLVTVPVEGEEEYEWAIFSKTPKMSTYLVAIIIGDFSRVPTEDPRQFVLVRDEAAPNAVQAAGFAPLILTGLEEKLATPYPLEKLDHAGVLGFGGGMENWGLIIYGEPGVADEGAVASLTLMTHETAHMWTGDLVTCQWWNVTWLNEGMTNFLTYYSADLIDTSFNYMDFLGTVLMDSAMEADMDSDALPMVVPIEKPEDVGNAFSGPLIYNRGGNIGRFMYYLLGEEIFLKGMKEYFAVNSYQPVTEEDLFLALGNAASEAGIEFPQGLEALMTQWTRQAGFPVVSVTRGASIGDTTTFIATQKRHLSVPYNDHDDQTLWTVPLTWATKANPDFNDMTVKTFLISTEWPASYIDIPGVGPNDWIIFNNRRMGYYRVNYDTQSWLLIFEALGEEPEAVDEVTRAAIVADLTEFCIYGLVEPVVCGQLDLFLRRAQAVLEDDLVDWLMAENASKLLAAISGVENKHQPAMASHVPPVKRLEEKVSKNPVGLLKELWEKRQTAKGESLAKFFTMKKSIARA